MFNYIRNWSNFFNKTGNNKKYITTFEKITQYIYNNNIHISDEFKYLLGKNIKYKNINFLLDNIFKKAQINFHLKCIKVNKKYRKKLKKKYMFQLNYLNKEKIHSFFLKNLTHILGKQTNRGLRSKIIATIIPLIIDYKNSELFKIKLLTLKHISLKK